MEGESLFGAVGSFLLCAGMLWNWNCGWHLLLALSSQTFAPTTCVEEKEKLWSEPMQADWSTSSTVWNQIQKICHQNSEADACCDFEPPLMVHHPGLQESRHLIGQVNAATNHTAIMQQDAICSVWASDRLQPPFEWGLASTWSMRPFRWSTGSRVILRVRLDIIQRYHICFCDEVVQKCK